MNAKSYYVMAGNIMNGQTDFIVSTINAVNIKSGKNVIHLFGVSEKWHHMSYYSDENPKLLQNSIRNAFSYLGINP